MLDLSGTGFLLFDNAKSRKLGRPGWCLRMTEKLTQERRTDIVYGWNDNTRRIELVFEFKKLGRQKSHRRHYLRENGLGRFVTGIYSRRQAVAAIVGI